MSRSPFASRFSRSSRAVVLSAIALSSAVVGAFGCSGAPGTDLDDRSLPEHTGAISAKLTNVPADVQCVEIYTSDYRIPTIQIDVTPGATFTRRIAPLDVGYVALWGNAYNRPCNVFVPQWGDAGAAIDAGPSNDAPTWQADQTWINVVAGQTTPATLRFHQPGAVDVTIDFDNCASNDGGSFCPAEDGGVDGGPIFWDAAPPPAIDAGSAP